MSKLRSINHTQIPNDFLDEWLPKLKGSEIQIFLIICRQTIGWHKETDRISTSQLEEKTGLSNRCIIDAVRSLGDHGLIKTETINDIKSYEVVYEESSQVESEPMKKVHSTYEESSQGAYEQSSHTKETVTKETKQNIKDDDVFDYSKWVDFWNKINDAQCRVTDRKRKQIRQRLKTYSDKELKQSIINRSKDSWINGEGKKHKTSWSTFWRNDEKPERYLNVNEDKPQIGDQNKIRRINASLN